jgi:hypothetical protein
VSIGQALDPVGRHHPPVFEVPGARPRELGHGETEARRDLGRAVQDAKPLGDDLGATPSPGITAMVYVSTMLLPRRRRKLPAACGRQFLDAHGAPL